MKVVIFLSARLKKHLSNIFNEGELQKESVCRKFRRTAADGKEYNTQFYNLDAIISVGYRVNSIRATQFRQWCTYILRQYAIRGYVIDKKRMENGAEEFAEEVDAFCPFVSGWGRSAFTHFS